MAILKKPSDLAFLQDEQVNNLIASQSFLFVEIGKQLKAIRDNKFYKELGYETFDSYLASKGMPISTGYAYIYIHEIYIVKLKYSHDYIAQVPWYKLQLIAPRIKNIQDKDQADEWLEKAKALSPADLKEELREEKGKQIDKFSFPQLWRCKTCKKWRIDIEEDEFCKCNYDKVV